MKGRVTRVVRSEHAKRGQVYLINESLLLPSENGEKEPGICIVVWDDDEAFKNAQTLIGEYLELEY